MYLGNADSESGLRFPKFQPQNPFLGKLGPKKSKLSVLPENWHNDILEVLIPNLGLDFQNSDPKIHFWANLGQKKIIIVRFTRKLAHMVYWKS